MLKIKSEPFSLETCFSGFCSSQQRLQWFQVVFTSYWARASTEDPAHWQYVKQELFTEVIQQIISIVNKYSKITICLWITGEQNKRPNSQSRLFLFLCWECWMGPAYAILCSRTNNLVLPWMLNSLICASTDYRHIKSCSLAKPMCLHTHAGYLWDFLIHGPWKNIFLCLLFSAVCYSVVAFVTLTGEKKVKDRCVNWVTKINNWFLNLNV